MSYQRNDRSNRRSRHRQDAPDDNFTCRNCGMLVTCAPELAGVRNRNHCPYCLWSRHMDSRTPGDRLSGCRATMRPVGLAAKPAGGKYASDRLGELMLIHRCTVCGRVSANRIAADDNAPAIIELLDGEGAHEPGDDAALAAAGVTRLDAHHRELVHGRLFGRAEGTTPAPDSE